MIPILYIYFHFKLNLFKFFTDNKLRQYYISSLRMMLFFFYKAKIGICYKYKNHERSIYQQKAIIPHTFSFMA